MRFGVSASALVALALLQVAAGASVGGTTPTPMIEQDPQALWALIGQPDEPVVVLAVAADCPFAAEAAPLWAEWLATVDGAVRVVAVTADDPEPAEALLQGLVGHVPVFSTSTRPSAAGFATRSPWIYILDEEGALVFGGHGKELGPVSVALESLRQGSVNAVR